MTRAAEQKVLSQSWLEQLLRQHGLVAELAGVSTEPFGEGTTSDVCRVSLSYAEVSPDETPPAELVVKRPHPSRVSHALFENEVSFYQGASWTLPSRAPHCWLARVEPEEMVLVLESVVAHSSPDVSTEVAAEVVDWLGEFHRAAPAFIPLPKPLPNRFGQMECRRLLRLSAAYLPRFLRRYRDRLSTVSRAAIENVLNMPLDILLASSDDACLLHGDLRGDNVLASCHGIRVVDWQAAGWGPAYFDLAYFLTTSIPIDRRRAEEPTLLMRYAGEQPTIDAYRRALLLVVALVPVLAVQFATRQRYLEAGPSDAVFARFSAITEDWGLARFAAS